VTRSTSSRSGYVLPHGGCPTFDIRPLPDAEPSAAVDVVQLDDPDERSQLCDSILHELPDWFGIEEATAAYVRDVAELPTFALEDKGFLAVKIQTACAAEVYVMGVRPAQHGQGVGTALLAAAEDYLRERGVQYLQVKTLGPSDPDAGYARTRRFYEARGFVALEELPDLWEHNPCLIMVKRL
jgi:GNAT superfamily N-acetyltransferase